ncbi:MAG: lipoprotein [Bacteroidales bacterium]|nr:lipoprotein [Bacteroidales bacterium]
MKRIFLLLFAALALAACNAASPGGDRPVPPAAELEHGMIVLGEQLEDPYSVDNISRALQNLYPTRSERVIPEPTDLYIRFLPADREQLDRLLSLGLTLLDHPVDYRILREGDYYHDPAVPEGAITWQYAVVSADFPLPEGIRCEVLDECYIAENDPGSRADGIDWTAVEREAYRLTGNGALLADASRDGTAAAVHAEGDILLVDPAAGADPVGVHGVMVVCNSFVKIGKGFTDEKGHYRLNRAFSTEMRYRIVFKNEKGFATGFNFILIPASVSTLGTAGPEGVSVTIDAHSERSLFCRSVINNACWDYFASCSGDGGESINMPPDNLRIWCFQFLDVSGAVMMQHGCLIDQTLVGQWLGSYASLVKMFLPDLVIGLKSCSDCQDIYSLVLHECAHASHFTKVGNDFWDPLAEFMLKSFASAGTMSYGSEQDENSGYVAVAEMWAYSVQTALMNKRYGNGLGYGYSYWFHPQILSWLDERGITRFKVFKALDAEVADRQTLRERIIYYYPEYKSIINQAFSRYE